MFKPNALMSEYGKALKYADQEMVETPQDYAVALQLLAIKICAEGKSKNKYSQRGHIHTFPLTKASSHDVDTTSLAFPSSPTKLEGIIHQTSQQTNRKPWITFCNPYFPFLHGQARWQEEPTTCSPGRFPETTARYPTVDSFQQPASPRYHAPLFVSTGNPITLVKKNNYAPQHKK